MDMRFYKVEIRYDDNCGSSHEQTLYLHCNNTSDFQSLVDSEGRVVECRGTDSFIRVLEKALALENYDDGGEGVLITEVKKTDELPRAVRIALCGRRKEEPKPNSNVIGIYIRDELQQTVMEWRERFDVNEEDVWEAVRYWGEDWTHLMEGRKKAREIKAGDRVKVVSESDYNRSLGGPSWVGRTGVVEKMEFSRSHGDVALLLFDGQDPNAIPRVRYGVCVKYLEII